MADGLTRRGAASALGGAILIGGGLAQAQTPPAAAPAITPDDEASLEPTQVASGKDAFSRITVPVTINGLGPFDFMVDTGANRSCISTTLAARLALPDGGKVVVNTIIGRRTRQSVLVDSLQVGGRAQRRVKVPVLPFVGTDIEGLLAVDWLRGQRLVLNMAEKHVAITSSRRDVSSRKSVVVPARKRIGQLTIVDADMGAKPISCMIDSGAQLSIGNPTLRRMLDKRLEAKLEKVTMVSVTGETFVGDMMYLPFLRVGGVQMGNVPVVFADLSVFGLWGLADKPALVLGMDLMAEFTAVTLDFGRSTVTFEIA
ncbi:retroviral-like aspartic protease family protein [Phenylobacterium sp.]|uniref:retroviral-like aspartic protease family protein n=1 Tax=Phenylobacterium sp. TaxID=1871053 RepID=UPI00286D8EFD|nr:retroviral-like aspartic protease family protein [Phenylobacterium sp.]